MILRDLEALPDFALLGSGFTGGPALLLTGLRPGGGAWARLVFAPFDAAGRGASLYAAGRVEQVELALDEPVALSPAFDEAAFAGGVRRVREAIAAGDVYQVCLTGRAPLGGSSGAGLLSAMCARGVPRFAAWVRLPDGAEFVSASPELFFEIDGARIRCEPMKGTAGAGASEWLAASEKDRCELAMITDLIRNDLTPICRPRSVAVPCDRRLLQLAYATQAVSDVTGELLEGTTPLDALHALHPGGSVTGAPKQAALTMIRELEPGPRGAYCGALGFWPEERRSTFSLLIRTAERHAQGWTYGVGSGVVYDSDPELEVEELRIKLGALRCATRP